jgi:hypothetical protein
MLFMATVAEPVEPQHSSEAGTPICFGSELQKSTGSAITVLPMFAFLRTKNLKMRNMRKGTENKYSNPTKPYF